MSRSSYPSSRADQFPVRLPEGVRDAIKDLAKANGRSMNTEMVIAIEKHLASEGVPIAPPVEASRDQRLDTFVAAAFAGMLAHGLQSPNLYGDAYRLGENMLAFAEKREASQ